jgi:N-acyl-D-aspartate/D-glutamate deacylase
MWPQPVGIEPADVLLDLTVEHGPKLRWRTVVANDREDVLDQASIAW